MASRWIRALSLLLVLTVPALAGMPGAGRERGPLPRAAAVPAEDPNNARVIVKYRADGKLMRALALRSGDAAAPRHAAALAARLALPLRDGRVLGSRSQSLYSRGLSSSQLAARLAAEADVEWAVPDQRRRINALPNDPYLPAGQTVITPVVGQWYLRAPDAAAPAAINAVGAWELTHGSRSVTVAVLDTGVRKEHPDLQGKLYAGYDFVHDTALSNDGDGRDGDASDPGDWSGPDSDCGQGDSSWHGTQTAGLIGAATDNGIGMASVGYDVMLLPLRVLGRCGGYDSDIIAAMRWAAALSDDVGFGAVVRLPNANPARVINMSLGSTGACPNSYRDVIAELNAAKVTVVVAAGNEAGIAVGVPANCPGAIAVTGVRHFGSKVGYSNLGPEAAIAAPAGNCVNLSGPCLYPLLTTVNSGPTNAASGTDTYSDSFNSSLGTSFAAPLVASTVALMVSVDPTLTPAQVKAALQATARPFPSSGSGDDIVACKPPSATEQLECYCTTSTCGAGMLDAAAAVAKVMPPAIPPPSATITVSSSTPTAGESITLSGSGSTAHGGRTIAGYQWAITAGAGLASFSGATNAASATLVTSAAGIVTVSLTVIDSAGVSASSSISVTIAAAPVPVPPPSDGGGGGGALGFGWLLALGAAVLGLRRTEHQPPARCARGPRGARALLGRPGEG